MKVLLNATAALAAVARGLVATMLVVMLAALTAQIVMRYFFNVALTWSEELSLTLFGWSVLLSAAVCVRENRHVRLALIMERLPGSTRVAGERVVHLLTAFFGLYLAYAGWIYVSETGGMTSPSIGFPITYLYAAAPVCGALMALFAFEHAVLGTVPASESDVDE